MADAHLRVFRGSPGETGRYDEYDVPVEEGMVVLDAVHWIQGHGAPDLAVRWNCKAAKCGSCSAEVDGRPSLMCKTRLSDYDLEESITVEPMRSFPLIRDLVTDVSWNYEVNRTIEPFSPPDTPVEEWRWKQQDIERVQEYRKCIECFLCQDVCHVLRNHETGQPFLGPRYMVRVAGLELHPADRADRRAYLKEDAGIGYCNITKCCTEVCPEHIKITDNAIIPLKERVADEFYDPIQWFWRKLRGRPDGATQPVELPVLHATGTTTTVVEPKTTVIEPPAPQSEPAAEPTRGQRPRAKAMKAPVPEAVEPSRDGAGTAAVEPAPKPRRVASRSTRSS